MTSGMPCQDLKQESKQGKTKPMLDFNHSVPILQIKAYELQ